MTAITLQMEDFILQETEKLSKEAGTTRDKYISLALTFYNKIMLQEQSTENKELALQFAKASVLCREESMNVLAEFEQLPELYD
ncbi:MAG: hypothetical protein V4543_01400 [Bacteroidota bacterium]